MVERAKLEKNIKNITASKERTRVPTEKRGTEEKGGSSSEKCARQG